MDYQTFNGQQPSFGGFPPSAHSPQAGLPPQAQFQQAGQSFPYGGQQFAGNGQAFPNTGSMVGHGAGSGSGAPMNMMQQPMQPGGMQRGERVTCAHTSRPIVSCCPRLILSTHSLLLLC
jgi:hypothetical protein